MTHNYAPELDQRCRPHFNPINDSWRVDETYVKLAKQWKYLYRAVGSDGNTIDFLLTARGDAEAAKRFFIKALKATHNFLRHIFCPANYLRHNR